MLTMDMEQPAALLPALPPLDELDRESECAACGRDDHGPLCARHGLLVVELL